MTSAILLLAAVLDLQAEGVAFTVDAEPRAIDPGRNVTVTMTATAAADRSVRLPDLAPRLRGFADSECLEEEPVTGRDGRVTRTAVWKLVPLPCADDYRVAPFAVEVTRTGTTTAFVAGPIRFDPPAARTPAEGEMVLDLKRDKPALTWRKVGRWALAALAVLLVLGVLTVLVIHLIRRLKERKMRPIERAWIELSRLLAKHLPKRGHYKDFYVELTMVVRRYIQRKYGIRAPHLTTEEFLRELVAVSGDSRLAAQRETLRTFLESADLVKFAGVQATVELAEEATGRARAYLQDDNTREEGQS